MFFYSIQVHYGDGQSFELEPQHNGNWGRLLPSVLHVSYLSGFPKICEFTTLFKIYFTIKIELLLNAFYLHTVCTMLHKDYKTYFSLLQHAAYFWLEKPRRLLRNAATSSVQCDS